MTRKQQRAHLATLCQVLPTLPQVKTPYGTGQLVGITASPSPMYPAGTLYVQFPPDHKPARHADADRPFHPRQVTLLPADAS